MKNYDVVIVGSGLAGLQCARLLSSQRQGAKILLVDRKTDLTKGIHTTGIFVRKTLEDFNFPPETLGKPVRRVALYSPRLKALNLSSRHDEFRVGKMGLLYESYLQECVKNGVEFSSSTRYVSAEKVSTGCGSGRAERGKVETHSGAGETIVNLEKNGESFAVKTKVLVGADGANSRVAKDLNLDENREFIVGVEEVWTNVSLKGEPVLHCFLDARLAPGYLAWVTNDGEEVHIGVGGYHAGFIPREALEEFKAKVVGKIVDLQAARISEKRGGKIPVGGVLKRIACERGLLIGDASGAVSPLTAGGLDPCLRLSKMAAELIRERLETGNPQVLLKFSGELFRARFVSRLWMRRILAAFSNQFLLEFGFAVLRLPLLKKFAAHVFFGRGSFPDVDLSAQDEKTKISLAVESTN
ncbi:MAG: NAD(P)/FAD-dependent oxidoreductase [Acidobacteriota bacterium]|nr:NAD(P)/FAD-dependent oxidoreductase [Acidobacteriota bacterium]